MKNLVVSEIKGMLNMKISPQSGFTLIEIMIVVVIVAVLAGIAFPSYQEYVRRTNASQAQDQLMQIAMALDKHRSRNFNYLSFTLPKNQTVVPQGATSDAVKYDIVLTSGHGQSWVLTAQSKDPYNFSFLMSNTGLRCKNKTWENIDAEDISCGTGQETW